MSSRRNFLQKFTAAVGLTSLSPFIKLTYAKSDVSSQAVDDNNKNSSKLDRKFNGPYAGSYLNRVAFPIGGIGAGMGRGSERRSRKRAGSQKGSGKKPLFQFGDSKISTDHRLSLRRLCEKPEIPMGRVL